MQLANRVYICIFIPVCTHLPRLFHIATLLVCTGPLSLRASVHGFVINVIHSLCTSSLAKQISGELNHLIGILY